jgi:hypothetical protein
VVGIGASVGVAIYPTHGGDVETLLVRADAAMYSAKRAGGGVAISAPEAPEAPVVVPGPPPSELNPPSRALAATPNHSMLGSIGAIDRRSQAELLRTIGQDLDHFGTHPQAIICEDNGYRVRENGRDSGPERWFPIDELVRESMSRALRRQPH